MCGRKAIRCDTLQKQLTHNRPFFPQNLYDAVKAFQESVKLGHGMLQAGRSPHEVKGWAVENADPIMNSKDELLAAIRYRLDRLRTVG